MNWLQLIIILAIFNTIAVYGQDNLGDSGDGAYQYSQSVNSSEIQDLSSSDMGLVRNALQDINPINGGSLGEPSSSINAGQAGLIDGQQAVSVNVNKVQTLQEGGLDLIGGITQELNPGVVGPSSELTSVTDMGPVGSMGGSHQYADSVNINEVQDLPKGDLGLIGGITQGLNPIGVGMLTEPSSAVNIETSGLTGGHNQYLDSIDSNGAHVLVSDDLGFIKSTTAGLNSPNCVSLSGTSSSINVDTSASTGQHGQYLDSINGNSVQGLSKDDLIQVKGATQDLNTLDYSIGWGSLEGSPQLGQVGLANSIDGPYHFVSSVNSNDLRAYSNGDMALIKGMIQDLIPLGGGSWKESSQVRALSIGADVISMKDYSSLSVTDGSGDLLTTSFGRFITLYPQNIPLAIIRSNTNELSGDMGSLKGGSEITILLPSYQDLSEISKINQEISRSLDSSSGINSIKLVPVGSLLKDTFKGIDLGIGLDLSELSHMLDIFKDPMWKDALRQLMYQGDLDQDFFDSKRGMSCRWGYENTAGGNLIAGSSG